MGRRTTEEQQLPKQTINIDGLLQLINSTRKRAIGKGDLATMMYKHTSWGESYCRYRLIMISNGKQHMTIGDLILMKQASKLSYPQVLQFITILQTTKNRQNGNNHSNSKKRKS